jgi:hypothetical protein
VWRASRGSRRNRIDWKRLLAEPHRAGNPQNERFRPEKAGLARVESLSQRQDIGVLSIGFQGQGQHDDNAVENLYVGQGFVPSST